MCVTPLSVSAPSVRRLKVYVSGPLTTGGASWDKMNRALDVGRTLIDRGYSPLVPHYTYLLDRDGAVPHDVWMEVDLPWVEVADVVLRLPGESRGAAIETDHAEACGVPVYHSLDELPPPLVPIGGGPPDGRRGDACGAAEAGPAMPIGNGQWGHCGGGPGWKLARQVAEARSTDCPVSASEPGVNGGNPIFLSLLDEIRALHLRKAADYGSDSDPLANVRSAADIGLAPEVGAWLRARDKVHRIDAFFRRGSLANESVEDSLQDLAAYSLIALVMIRGG